MNTNDVYTVITIIVLIRTKVEKKARYINTANSDEDNDLIKPKSCSITYSMILTSYAKNY